MKEQFSALWAKVVENKAVVIQVGAVLVGAALGAVVATAINRAQEESQFLEEEILMEVEEEVGDEEAETE